MELRTNMREKMFCYKMLLFVVLILCPIAFAEAVVDAPTGDAVLLPCESKCGCEEIYIYDAENDRCLINFTKALKRVVVIYDKNNVEILADDEMARKIYIEGENLFKWIIISVVLFITCATICVISACIYCCRINYTDRTMKRNVKALAKRLNKDYNSKKMTAKRAPLPAMAESCSVVVDPAGIYVA